MFFFTCVGAGDKCFGSSCYLFEQTTLAWANSREKCKAKGGDLVSMETEAEWEFINSQIQSIKLPGYDEWYVGLKKQGQQWMWVSGKPLTINKWQPHQPSGDGDVVVMAKDYPARTQGLFNDLRDTQKRAYICEIPQGKR